MASSSSISSSEDALRAILAWLCGIDYETTAKRKWARSRVYPVISQWRTSLEGESVALLARIEGVVESPLGSS